MPKTTISEELYDYNLKYGVRENATLTKLRLATSLLPNSQMQISPDQGALLALLAQICEVNTFLEIGTFTGYSCLWVAQALAKNAKITTLDLSDQHLALALQHWQEAGVANKIEPLIAPAKESLTTLIAKRCSYDMAFIDANKAEYIDYYELCLELIRPGGLIVIDNVFMYGQVLEAEPDKNYVKTLQKLNELIRNDQRVDICMLAIGDGMTLARKKKDKE
jgi:caffeoyl-CoA O-methyltransferase